MRCWGTRTAGTGTFSSAEPEKNAFRIRFRIRIRHEIEKSKKTKKWGDNFLGNNAASNINEERFCQKKFFVEEMCF